MRSFRNAESKGGGVDERVGKSATWLLLLIVAEREREDERGRGRWEEEEERDRVCGI